MEIDKREELISLFDIYGSLLTMKQREYFESYYFYDLSLSEIALENNVSRNAVFDMLKKTSNILKNYEMNLKIHQKNTDILNIIKNVEGNEILDTIKKIIEE